MRITDDNYQVKEVIALETTGTTRGGANKSLFITAFNALQSIQQHITQILEHLSEFKKEIWTKLLT